MKTFKILSIIAAVLVVTIFSCKKEDEVTIPYNCTANMIADQIDENTSNNTVNLTTLQPINGENGTVITYSANSFFLPDGTTLATGDIDVDVLDANDNKDMLLMDFPTVTEAGGLLTSGGILAFTAEQNGETLIINPANPPIATMPASSGAPMGLWTGTRNNGVLTWSSQAIGTTGIDSIFNQTTNTYTYSYTFPITDATVVYNCDDIVNTNPSTTVTVTLPEGMDGSNSTVYCYFTDINSVVTFYDNNNDRIFDCSLSLPAGEVVQFVAVSQIEGIRKWHVSDTIPLTAGTHPCVIETDEMDVALCDDALRLFIKDALTD